MACVGRRTANDVENELFQQVISQMTACWNPQFGWNKCFTDAPRAQQSHAVAGTKTTCCIRRWGSMSALKCQCIFVCLVHDGNCVCEPGREKRAFKLKMKTVKDGQWRPVAGSIYTRKEENSLRREMPNCRRKTVALHVLLRTAPDGDGSLFRKVIFNISNSLWLTFTYSGWYPTVSAG